MAQAPRWNKKATKIAYKVMGVPANIRAYKERTEEQKKIDRRLLFEESTRSR